MQKYLKWAFGALMVLTQTALAVPVIPGASGFGINTPAGRGGQVIKVTNLNSSGSGSLLACISASGPRVYVFEVAGNINVTNDFKIMNPNITIAGQTAPHPGITILGAGLMVRASDVLVQHIAVRPGDRLDGPSPHLRNALMISPPNSDSGTISNIVIDHCSFSWSVDQIANTWLDVDNVTIRNSVFAYPLDDSIHPQTPSDGYGHGFGPLWGYGPGKIDMSGSVIAHTRSRSPRTQMAGFVFRNNVVYNYGNIGTELSGKSYVSYNDIVNNVYIEGTDTTGPAIKIGPWGDDLLSGSRVYETGNLKVRTDGSTTSNVLDPVGSVMSGTPLFASLSSQAIPVNSGSFVENLVANAGRRPATRDSDDVDSRTARDVINRTGRWINCVEDDGSSRCSANAGGWPANSQARITLNIPANPSGDSDGDGYTNLEEWLHDHAAAVEFGAEPPPPVPTPMPPTFSSIN